MLTNKTVIITGGRDYQDTAKMSAVLDFLSPDVVVEGGARGADSLAHLWCIKTGTTNITVNADWSLGPKAGPLRNKKMLSLLRFQGEGVQQIVYKLHWV